MIAGPGDVRPTDQVVDRNRHSITAVLQSVSSDYHGYLTLQKIAADELHLGSNPRMSKQQVIEYLSRELESGRLRIVRPPRELARPAMKGEPPADSPAKAAPDAAKEVKAANKPPQKKKKKIELKILFQRCPGKVASVGIAGLDYVAIAGGTTSKGKTAADGTVTIRMYEEETAKLTILGTEYQVTARTGELEAINTRRGQQRRLRLLGYQIGHGGPEGNGVDGQAGYNTERSLLDFQADQGIAIDASPGPTTRTRLTTAAG